MEAASACVDYISHPPTLRPTIAHFSHPQVLLPWRPRSLYRALVLIDNLNPLHVR